MQVRRPEPALTGQGVSRLALVVAAGVIALDHATKWWAQDTLDVHDIDIVWKLRLHLVHNPGGAFGFGSKFAPLFALAALAIVLVLFRSGRQFQTSAAQVSVGLVLGGAFGNLLDRLFRHGHGFLGGRVVDFIDVQIWPVWNVADMGVVSGAILLALVVGRDERT